MMSLAEAEDIIEHWREEPSIGVVLRAALRAEGTTTRMPASNMPRRPEDIPMPVPTEISQQEFEKMVAAEQAFADRHGWGSR